MPNPKLLIKWLIVLAFAACLAVACSLDSEQPHYVIASSKAYEASLFRQHCAICHGTEGTGKTLSDGTQVPSLREGDLKKRSEAEIYAQIANGGNGMTPFRGILTERELRLMTEFVKKDLRGE